MERVWSCSVAENFNFFGPYRKTVVALFLSEPPPPCRNPTSLLQVTDVRLTNEIAVEADLALLTFSLE